MRSLAAFLARTNADVFAACEIDAGDALAVATRFALQWGYRGGQALFWKPALTALSVQDTYLPFSPLRPFERRGFLSVAIRGLTGFTAVATQIGRERDQRIRETRYLRTRLRALEGSAIVFGIIGTSRTDLYDLGFVRAGCRGADDEAIYVRGFRVLAAGEDAAGHRGIGVPLCAQLEPLTEKV